MIGVVDVQRSEEWTAIRRIVVELVPVELRPTLAARLMALDQDPRRGTSPDLNPN